MHYYFTIYFDETYGHYCLLNRRGSEHLHLRLRLICHQPKKLVLKNGIPILGFDTWDHFWLAPRGSGGTYELFSVLKSIYTIVNI